MLSRGGSPPVEATVVSPAVVAVLEGDVAGTVGCTTSDEAGRPAEDAAAVVAVLEGDVAGTVG